MAITNTQLIVGLYNAAPGGYKADVDAFVAANGANGQVLLANALISNTLLNPQFNGVNLLTDAAFAKGVVTSLLSGLSADLTTLLANYVSSYMASNPTLTRGAILVQMIQAVVNIPVTDPTLGTASSAFVAKVTAADAYVGTSTDLTVLAGVVGVTPPAVNVGQTFTLTTGIDSGAAFTGGASNDTFNATHLTLNATDVLNGALGTDTLSYVDTGTTGGALAGALVSGIENINIRNLNGTAAVAAVKESVSITFSDYTHAANSSITVGGVVLALTASTTAANLAVYFATTANVPAGYVVTSISGATVTYQASTAGVLADMTASVTLGVASTLTTPVPVVTTQGAAAVTSTGVTDTVTVANFTGATAFNAENSTNDVTFTGVGATQSVGMFGSAQTGNVNFTTSSAAVAAATINLSGGTSGGTISSTNTNLTSATINSTGTASNTATGIDLSTGTTVASLTINADAGLTVTNLTADYTATAALTVSGAATSVSLGSGATANFKTINASGLTAGGLSIAGSTNLTSFIGGTGNDTFTTAAAYGAATAGMINAGAGTDILVMSAASDIDTAAKGALYTGFETLRTAGNQDMSLIAGITAVQPTAAGSITQMTATQAAAVRVRTTAQYSFALADSTGTADVLKLTLGTGSTTASALSITTGLTANGFESLEMTTGQGPTSALANQTSTIAAFTADKLTSIVLKGKSFDLTNAATTKAVTIDASALTGNGTTGLTMAGTLVAGSVVTGSGVADAITLGTVGSTYNTGAGDDSISGTLAQYRSATVYNTIDGGTGTDTANITGGAALTMVDDDFKGLTGIEKITVATTGANDQSITTGGWFDAGFKATGVTLTTTTTTGAVTIAAGSFTGALTVSSTSGAVTGNVSITTGSGADSVTVVATSVSAGPVVISTGAGNDTIVGGAPASNITGGTGADTMTGGAAVDTYKFADTGDSPTTGFDTITNWVSGADIIDFTSSLTYLANATTSSAGVAGLGAGANSVATFNAADNTLALRIVAVEAAMTKSTAATNNGTTPTALNAQAFTFGSDTYVFVTDGTAGVTAGDSLIKLTGVALTNTFTIGTGNITNIS